MSRLSSLAHKFPMLIFIFIFASQVRSGLWSININGNDKANVIFFKQSSQNYSETIQIFLVFTWRQKKNKIKIFSFYLYQVKVMFKDISVGLAPAR